MNCCVILNNEWYLGWDWMWLFCMVFMNNFYGIKRWEKGDMIWYRDGKGIWFGREKEGKRVFLGKVGD